MRQLPAILKISFDPDLKILLGIVLSCGYFPSHLCHKTSFVCLDMACILCMTGQQWGNSPKFSPGHNNSHPRRKIAELVNISHKQNRDAFWGQIDCKKWRLGNKYPLKP